MVFIVNLDKLILRITLIVLTVVFSIGILRLVYVRFIVNFLTAKERAVSVEMLAAAVSSLPHSARLQARFADVLLGQSAQDSQRIVQAEEAVGHAINLSPFNARFRLLLAVTKSLSGQPESQETPMRAALSLAPHNTQIHWRLANVLLRAEKLEESLDEFRVAVTADSNLLPVSLDLLWQMADGEITPLVRATGERAKNRLVLAQFLMQKSKIDDAVRLFSQIEKTDRLATPETGNFVNALLAAGKIEMAYQLWTELLEPPDGQQSLLWNGSFENASPSHLNQFDWQLRGCEYAQLSIDSYLAHTGTKSLRLDFFGRDTTRLTNEIKQLIVVRPGTRYRLSGFIRTAKLQTPEGPRLVVMTQDGTHSIAASAPVKAAATDWQAYTVDFTAPPKTPALMVAVQRIPKTSYDHPTQGTIWFDDFTLTELHN